MIELLVVLIAPMVLVVLAINLAINAMESKESWWLWVIVVAGLSWLLWGTVIGLMTLIIGPFWAVLCAVEVFKPKPQWNPYTGKFERKD